MIEKRHISAPVGAQFASRAAEFVGVDQLAARVTLVSARVVVAAARVGTHALHEPKGAGAIEPMVGQS